MDLHERATRLCMIAFGLLTVLSGLAIAIAISTGVAWLPGGGRLSGSRLVNVDHSPLSFWIAVVIYSIVFTVASTVVAREIRALRR